MATVLIVSMLVMLAGCTSLAPDIAHLSVSTRPEILSARGQPDHVRRWTIPDEQSLAFMRAARDSSTRYLWDAKVGDRIEELQFEEDDGTVFVRFLNDGEKPVEVFSVSIDL